MIIEETKGNLLEAKTEALVNAVNCVGVMGKGIALQFRREFSEDYFKDYKRACQSGELAIGIRFGIWDLGIRNADFTLANDLTTKPKSKSRNPKS